jgi:competence protein ComEA
MKRLTTVVLAGLLCGLVLGGLGRGVGAAGAAPVDTAHRVDLNSASADDLARLPGIGPAKAQAIIQHRTQEPFAKPEDLRKVKGIGAKLYDRVKEQVTVGAPSPAHKDHGG